MKTQIAILDFDDIKNPLLGAGQARATFEVGKRLAKKGFTMTVYCSRYPGSQNYTHHGISYVHVGLGSKNIKLNNLVYILSIPFVVPKIKADLIMECFTAPISTLFSPLFTRIPVVALSTMFDADVFSQKYHLPLSWIEKLGCRFYRYFIALSKPYADKMRNLNQQVTTTVIPEGVDSSFFKIKRSAKPKHILFLARFDMQQKGIDLLLEAYSKVADQIKLPLVLAGYGTDEGQIRNLAQKLGISDKVIFPGAIYGKQKEKLMSEAAFAVLPSRHETFSCFALEALAAGLPIVRFDVDGLSWMETTAMLKSPAFNVDDFARLLLRASRPEFFKIQSAVARSFAAQFSWDTVAQQFAAFFQKILQDTHHLQKPSYSRHFRRQFSRGGLS
ncbi:glycosyltransferase family 1 protein [Candidatus Microgenomates bacterium]|nr:MAG: glycosyltransferase family 1 protein [Candidatus Microgenomates bacterium]